MSNETKMYALFEALADNVDALSDEEVLTEWPRGRALAHRCRDANPLRFAERCQRVSATSAS